MEIRIEGFSHKLPLLAERVFRQLAGGRTEEDGDSKTVPFGRASFDREKEALVRRYRNHNMQVGLTWLVRFARGRPRGGLN